MPTGTPDWRSVITEADEALILQWTLQVGLERFARIVAAIVDGEGKRSRRTDSELLQQMMRLKQQNPARGAHSIAEEVVRSSGRPHVEPDNLVDKLRDDFAEQQHMWSWFAKNAAVPFAPAGNPQPSSVEERVIGRIMEIIPKELNVYDELMDDAKKLGPEAVKLIKKCGGRKVNEFLEARITEQMSNKPSALPAPRRRMPRSFFDLIADDLERYSSRIVKGEKWGFKPPRFSQAKLKLSLPSRQTMTGANNPMPNTDIQPSDEVAAVRDRLLVDLPTIQVFAKALGVSVRTVERMAARKEVDIAQFGRMRRVIVSSTRDKAISRSKQPEHATVRRGRPSKKAA